MNICVQQKESFHRQQNCTNEKLRCPISRNTHTQVYDAAPEVLKFNLSIEKVSRNTRGETMFGLHVMLLQSNLKRRLQLMRR